MFSLCYVIDTLFLKYNNFILTLKLDNNKFIYHNNILKLLSDVITIKFINNNLIINCGDTLNIHIKNINIIENILSAIFNVSCDIIKNITTNITDISIILKNNKLLYEDNNIIINISKNNIDKNIIYNYNKTYSYEYNLRSCYF